MLFGQGSSEYNCKTRPGSCTKLFWKLWYMCG